MHGFFSKSPRDSTESLSSLRDFTIAYAPSGPIGLHDKFIRQRILLVFRTSAREKAKLLSSLFFIKFKS